MKHTARLIICLLLCTLVIAALAVSGEEEIYHDVIRLHIIAASDSERDQSFKLLVRDAVLETYGSALTSCPTRDDARAVLEPLLPAVETLAEAGCDAPVAVTLGEETYPTRDYETFSLPAGKYLSLRILIGDAAGHNWWCVLYPPLCLDTALEESSQLTDAEYGLLRGNNQGKYSVKFKVLELLEELFS